MAWYSAEPHDTVIREDYADSIGFFSAGNLYGAGGRFGLQRPLGYQRQDAAAAPRLVGGTERSGDSHGERQVRQRVRRRHEHHRHHFGRERRVAFHHQTAQPEQETAGGPSVYRARLVGGKLEGSFEVEGRNTPAIPWTGVRAPVIADRDDGTWKEGKPIALFNGKDIAGWKAPGARRAR